MPLVHLPELLGTLLLGASLGFCGGLFGIGGGIVAIPLLALAFGMPQTLAQGTALVMMVPTLLLGWWRYQQQHPAPLRQAVAIGLAASLSTALVAQLASRAPPLALRALFAVFLLLLAVRMRQQARQPAASQAGAVNARYLPLVGVLGGGTMGLFGIGGGLVATPLLTRLFGLRQTSAQSLALALVTPSAVIALGSYAQAGQVDWALGLPLAFSGLFTVSAGVALAHRLPETTLRKTFAAMLAGASLGLLGSLLWH